jgi:hypothetical protein
MNCRLWQLSGLLLLGRLLLGAVLLALHLSQHPVSKLIHYQELLHKTQVPKPCQPRPLACRYSSSDVQPQLL